MKNFYDIGTNFAYQSPDFQSYMGLGKFHRDFILFKGT